MFPMYQTLLHREHLHINKTIKQRPCSVFFLLFGLLIYRNIHYRFAWASRYSAIPSWVAKRIKPLTVEQVGFWLFWKLIFKFSSEARSNLDGQTWWECRSINLNKVKDVFFAFDEEKNKNCKCCQASLFIVMNWGSQLSGGFHVHESAQV